MGIGSRLASIGWRARGRAGAVAAGAAVGVIVVACATGGDVTLGDGTGGDGDASSADAGLDEDTGDMTVVLDAGVGNGDTGAPGDAASEAGDAAGACGYPNTCVASNSLGMLSGDTSGSPVTATGSTSDWMTIYVTEDDNSLVGKALTFKATLDVAAGTSYALYLYRNGNNSMTPECSTIAAQSSAPPSASLSLSWGEGTVANGKDDSETITVRVEYISGPCDASHAWNLTLTGDN